MRNKQVGQQQLLGASVSAITAYTQYDIIVQLTSLSKQLLNLQVKIRQTN